MGRIRRAVLPCCDLLHREYGSISGGTYDADCPRYWLFCLLPVKVGWSSARDRYDRALKLVEKDRMK